MNKKSVTLLGVILIGVVVIAGVSGFYLGNRQKVLGVKRSESNVSVEATSLQSESLDEQETLVKDSFDGSVVYEGEKYEVNRKIDKILFLGIDSSDQERKGAGIAEGGRSDTIILFVIDNEDQKITPLEISRDTMVDVDIYDNDGNYLTQGLEQITMQYSYGNSPQKASNLTKEKVSDLLGRTRIDGVICLTMDGIEPIVDSIGGVTLKLAEDETDIDSSYVEGAVIHMDGAAAFDFVHIRDVEKRGSNNVRMSRQTQFMVAMFNTIKSQGDSIVETMENAAGEYLYEDLNADTMMNLTHYDYSGEVLTLPGKNVIGNLHDEFYIDEDETTKLILSLLYKKVS